MPLRRTQVVLLAIGGLLALAVFFWLGRPGPAAEEPFVSCVVDPRQQDLRLYWQDEHGRPFKSLGQLRGWLQLRGRRLLFAMNGGMYRTGNQPVGLFIENGRTITSLDTGRGPGNFYLQPNGVFFLTTAHTAGICRTQDFRNHGDVSFATQSGPLLLVDGRINSAFQPGSANLNVRNGVGILPDNRVLFAMSKKEISFYEFAAYFQSRGCRQALYLDGFVSRAYLPAKQWTQTDGDFGVIIGVTAAN